MSDGLQAIAGNSLRGMIATVTNNRFFAVGVGSVVTCIVQSSSITTVMVVGFVNSGVMSLSQAIGVIMGANIGTTITGVILALKIGKWGLPMLGASAFVFLFVRNERCRFFAMTVMGIGMVFFGLELMKDACSVIKQMPRFEDWFQTFNANTYVGLLQCAAVGCILTTLVQSSSATLGITISLASQGIITYETAAALVLGENVGTTITAYLASLGSNTVAKRAAYFHMIFNLVGVLWITAIFHWYLGFVQWIIPGDVTESAMVGGQITYPAMTATIAATHSIFNIANTVIFLPFVRAYERFLIWAVPTKDLKEKARLTDLDVHLFETPNLAVEQSRQALERMGIECEKMLATLNESLQQDKPNIALASRLKQHDQTLDAMQVELVTFVTNLLSNNIPHSLADETRRQLQMANEYESISDYIASVEKIDRKLRQAGDRYSTSQQNDLAALNQFVAEHLKSVNEALSAGNMDTATAIEPLSKRVRDEVKTFRREHLKELSNGKIEPAQSVAYLASLNAFCRASDHATNLAEAISDEK